MNKNDNNMCYEQNIFPVTAAQIKILRDGEHEIIFEDASTKNTWAVNNKQ